MRDLPRSINSLSGAGRPSRDVVMTRPRPPILLQHRPAIPPAAAAGITRRRSTNPIWCVTTDAGAMLDSYGPEASGTGKVVKGRNESVSALFHVSSQVVTGCLACLSVVSPALVILSV